jgi:RHS repeat-associated protein
MYYDAFNRRRYKAHALGYGQEFYYGLDKNVLVDQAWENKKGARTTLDEYVWLDGRPVIAIRSNVDAVGVHEADAFEYQDVQGQCSRPMDDEKVSCGAFHLVTNLQSFPVLAISNFTGRVASFMLPDADGSVNSSRMMAYGGQGIAYPFRFDLNEQFSKQARFRSSWTGANLGYAGVQEFYLDGVPVLTPAQAEVGQTWSAWGPVVTGGSPVTWSVACPFDQDCASASDAFEWRAWESGAEQFHTRLRFPGQYHDAETDLYENWHRYYDPFNGRYLSPEPLLQDPSWVIWQHLNGKQTPAYAYAWNNPLRYVDPTGLGPDDIPISDEDFRQCLAQAFRLRTKCEQRPPVCEGGPRPDCQAEFEDSYEICYAHKFPDKLRRPPIRGPNGVTPPGPKDNGPKTYPFDFNTPKAPSPPSPRPGPRPPNKPKSPSIPAPPLR